MSSFKMQYRDINRGNDWADWSSQRWENEADARTFMQAAEIAGVRDSTSFVYRVVAADLLSISDWLSEAIGSHDISDAVKLKENYKLATGNEPGKWPVHTRAQTKAAMDARGLGGTLKEDAGNGEVWGYELASHLAYHFANGYRPSAMGRGTAYRQCIDALKAAGK